MTGGREHDAGAVQDLGALERDLEPFVYLHRAADLLRRSAGRRRRTRSPPSHARAPRGRPGDRPNRRSTTTPRRTPARRRPRRCSRTTPPTSAGRPDRVVVVLAASTSGPARRGIAHAREPCRPRRQRARRAPWRCRRASTRHPGVSRSPGSGPAAAGPPARRRATRAPRRGFRRRRASRPGSRSSMRPAHSSLDLLPVAELAQHVGHAAEARVLEHVGPAQLAQPDRGSERLARGAVVGDDLVRGGEPLVDLCGLARELVLERESETRADLRDAVVEPPSFASIAPSSPIARARRSTRSAPDRLVARLAGVARPRHGWRRSGGSPRRRAALRPPRPGSPFAAYASAATRRAASADARSPCSA